jgi:cytoskeletal protein CcmA (bactofilin family)
MAIKKNTANCIIGEGSIFDGRFQISGTIHIEGKFQGTVLSSGEVVVGRSGQAKTDVSTTRVVVAGTLIGNITATEEVYVMQTGKILGNITTPKLTLEPGVVTSGNVTITPDNPDQVVETVTSSYGADAAEAFEGPKKAPLRVDRNRVAEAG